MAGEGLLSQRGARLRLLNEGVCPPEANMARDEALLNAFLQGAIPPTLRVYQWASPAITYGVHQRLPESLIHEAERLGVPLFRRPTGGKAVLHGHDLTLALVWRPPLERPYPFAVYRTITPAFVEAFERLGVPARVGSARPDSPLASAGDGGDCFASATPADMVHAETGIKLMGCALRVFPEATLLQASIPIEAPRVPVERLFGHAHPAPPPLNPDLLIATLFEYLQEVLG